MSGITRKLTGVLAASFVVSLVAVPAAPASAAPTAKYRAVKSKTCGGRTFTGVVRTTSKPTKPGQQTTLVNWAYGIERTGGNTRNSTVEAAVVRWTNTLGWRHVTGIGHLHKSAIEDGKWHRGPQSNYPNFGYAVPEDLAVRIAVAFDGDNDRTCSVVLQVKDLKPL